MGPPERQFVWRWTCLAMDLFETIDVEQFLGLGPFYVGVSTWNNPNGATSALNIKHLDRLELCRVGALVNGLLPVALECCTPLLLELPDLPELLFSGKGFHRPCVVVLRVRVHDDAAV